MFLSQDFAQVFKQFQEEGLVISPWLSGLDGSGRFDPGVFEFLEWEAREFATTHWTEHEKVASFGSLLIPDRFAYSAVYETAASTAVFLAHERTGCLDVDEAIAQEAIQLVERFVAKHGFGLFVEVYAYVAAYDNLQALKYYGSIPEREFLLGSWHRPWIDYKLDDELMAACVAGAMRVVLHDNRRYVELTDYGLYRYQMVREGLEKAGYLKQKLQLLHISQFSAFKDFEALAEENAPEFMSLRREFLDWTGIQPGMRVLELGCAGGAFTFEAGLAERVGPTGQVIAMDPAPGMLARARSKGAAKGMDWVKFVQGRAEELPFEDHSFDAVVGSIFIHLTDIPVALEQMRRVAKSGGVVASYHPLELSYNVPFFVEWFAPVMELARKRNDKPKTFLPDRETLPKAFAEAGLTQIERKDVSQVSLFHDPDKIIDLYIEGIGLFQEELAELPWQARRDTVVQLRSRGKAVCRKYPEQERVIHVPNQMVRSIVR